MANEIVSTDFTNTLAAIAIQASLVKKLELTDLTNLVTKRSVPAGSASARFPVMSAGTAFTQLTEGNSLANATDHSSTAVTITPVLYGKQYSITDLADFVTARQEAIDIAVAATDAYVKTRNDALASLLSGFSVGVGSAGTEISEANILLAVRKLKEANAPGPYFCPVSPNILNRILSLYSANTNIPSTMIRDNVYQGVRNISLFGVNFVETNSFTNDINGDQTTAVFSPASLGLATAWDLKFVVQRDESLMGYKLVASSAWNVGELVDSYGIKFIVKAD